MRQALRAVREQLGEDAVILSSRRMADGVEITAAVDFDATNLPVETLPAPIVGAQPAPARVEPPPSRSDVPTFRAETAALREDASAFRAEMAALRQDASAFRAEMTAPRSAPALPEPARAAPIETPTFTPPAAFAAPRAPATSATDAMGTELKTLRRMLETQLAQLAWNDMTRRAPIHTEILRELTEIGISQDLAEHLIKQLPANTDLAYARRFAITGLSQYLLVTGDRWLENGGRVAFIGATGVGKTTTLAKLAVRWVLRHGPRDLALVAADGVRIGAQDQMQSLGQLLGAPVYAPETFESLPALLTRLHQPRLILIDTPGSSLRDAQLASRLGVLANSASQLETALVLAASTQAGALEEAVKRFAPANPSCCLLTKVDEAASLGGALSVLIRARLPVSYMSEGQRVPEDLRPARALELVSNAVRLAKASGAAADEDLLRRRFGKIAHALT
jgi:flagellar biosynthesis protein FlhF